MNRASAFISALLALSLAAPVALADEKQVCSDAYQAAQLLREQHRLVKARDQMKVCARAECPGFIAKDCADWLKDVDPRIPSVVLTAKNAAGADVTEAKVAVDGVPLVTRLDGFAVDVDPGSHTFTFEGADGKAEQKVVVTEGGKAQRVAVTFGGSSGAVVAAPAVLAVPAASPGQGGGAEAASSGLSFGARIGYALPIGSLDGATSLSDTFSGHLPLWLDVGYLFVPQLYVGAYLEYGVGFVANCTAGCSGNVVRFGVDAQYRILPAAKLDPWVGLGTGYEIANGSGPGTGTLSGSVVGLSFNGFEFFNVHAGLDYKPLANLGFGPFIAFSMGEYSSVAESVDGTTVPNTSIKSTTIHAWFYLGVRGRYDLHI